MKYKVTFPLLFLCVGAFLLRTQSVLWDHGYSLHPDERAIIMFTQNIHLPQSFTEFLSPDSPLNPNFFAYGSFPIYLLKGVAVLIAYINPDSATYTGQFVIGRLISAAADSGTLAIVFLVAQLLFSKRVGLVAAAIYAISVFPIQTSHFYAVDVLLTFFMTLSLYMAILFVKSKNPKYVIFSAISFGLALSTKISAAPLIVPIYLMLFLLPANSLSIKGITSAFAFKNLMLTTLRAVTFASVTILTTIIFQPYAYIDYASFIAETTAQSAMTESAFTFPYTLQYVGKIPYIYELTNIFLWGLGPIISLLSLLGAITFIKLTFKTPTRSMPILFFGIVTYLFIFFAIVGNFAVGWMRYMLPLYPFFAIFAGLATIHVVVPYFFRLKFLTVKIIFIALFSIAIVIWPISFLRIYSSSHPRIVASQWIHANIPPGSSLGLEHWDDHLPLYGIDNYAPVEFPLYEPDTPDKWHLMNKKLQNTDYIILSSNRLYTPLQKLTNCEDLPDGKCYTQTAQYYEKLFSGELGFQKVAEFTNYPTVPLLNFEINDQSADESFTVYDHPKVIIFQKVK